MLTKWLLCLGSGTLVIAGVAVLSFHEGQLYQAKRDTVIVANAGCFLSWAGLTALYHTNHADLVRLLDREMDIDSTVIADMAVKDPNLIGSGQYGLLVHVRDYRKQYGRHYEYEKGWGSKPTDVDRGIAVALAYLEAYQGTNSTYWHGGSKNAYLDQEVDAIKRGK